MKIEPLAEKDFDTLIRWAKSPKDLLLWAGPMFKYPLTHEQLKEQYLSNPKSLAYTMRIGGELAGMTELGAIDKSAGTATLCRIFVDDKFRGKGIAREMIKQVLKVGFGELSLRRIDLRVYANNSPAIKCYEKIGFKYEGNMRKLTKFDDEYWDVLVYSILLEEWKD